MSRRGGKRKHIVQLGSSSSKLHRYGYSKQLHSGEVPKLIGDYPDSDSEEEEDQAGDGQDAEPLDGTVAKDDHNTEKSSAPGDMDDELRNFLSEIEAIPMPPEDEKSQPPSSREDSPKDAPITQAGDDEKVDLEPSTNNSDTVDQTTTLPTSKPNQYSMFVRGDTEFVQSPSQPSVEEEKVSVNGEKVTVEELPEEPVTQWQMVQDEATQYYYYWNYVTNQVTWEIPSEYTQYLLQHKEYTDKMSKYSPEQLKALQDKKPGKSSTNGGASQVTGHLTSSSTPSEDSRTDQLASTDHSTKKTEETYRQRHERKKKKKKHKRKYSDDSSGDERPSKDQKRKEIGPEPKPLSPKTSSVTTSSGLLSIVPYASDQEEEDEVLEEEKEEPPPEVPFTAVDEGEAKSEDNVVQSTSSDLNMPDLSVPVTPVLSPEAMPDLSPAVMLPGPDEDSMDLPEDLNSALGVEGISSTDSTCNIPSINQEEGPKLGDGDGSPEVLGDSDIKVSSDEPSASVDVDSGTDIVKLKDEDKVLKKEEEAEALESVCDETVSETKKDTVSIEEKEKSLKVKKKKKEILDMFAEEFPSVDEKPPLSQSEASPVSEDKETVREPTSSELTEEGEISDSRKVNQGNVENVKIEPELLEKLGEVTPPTGNNDKHKDNESLPNNNEKSSTSLSIVASYGTEEDEEGELRDKAKQKKKKKDKKKDSKKRKSDEKPCKLSSELESKPVSDRVSDAKADTFLAPSSEPLPRKEADVLKNIVSEVVEDTTLDIDPEDINDIDRALELALEKKLERKMVELDSIGKDVTPQDGSPTSSKDDEHNVQNGQLIAALHDGGDTEKGQVADSEIVKAEVRDMAELALSKLEFLDINTDNLSRLQVLFIELQTRLSDWTAGGLSTTYFLQQLQVAEGLLDQYETSAVPEGWACQWDRSNNRYYYRNLTTNRIQWEYPEPDQAKESGTKSREEPATKSRDSSEEEKKSKSSSSRHRKREEKDRGKHDKRGSSRRHRRKRHRRRDPSSSSEASEEDISSRHQVSSRHHHKSKKKKRRRSEARSPSVEVIGNEKAREEVVEIPDDDSSPRDRTSRASTPSVALLPEPSSTDLADSLSGEHQPDTSKSVDQLAGGEVGADPGKSNLEGTTDLEAQQGGGGAVGVGEEEDVDGVAMEEEEGEKEEEEQEEEVNTAVISKPPQIIKPPEIAAVQPPQLYAAAPYAAAPATISSQPPAAATTEPKPDQHSQETEADKQAKKKKKDKKNSSSSSSMLMKKKHMSSMVQKWQRVKKEVEKEDRDKEIRQAAIRQKISELK